MPHRQLFTLIMTFCIVAFLLVLVHLLEYPNWATGANRVTWMYGDGTPVQQNTDKDRPWPANQAGDSGLEALSHDHALWTAYRSRGDSNPSNEGFARIDPASGIGTVWRFPKFLQHHSTIGLAIGPEQEVAIVYWANRLSKDMALGILDTEQGWVLKPQVLPHSDRARLLAVSWVSGSLTVIYQSNSYIVKSKFFSTPGGLKQVWKATFDEGRVDLKEIKIPELLPGKGKPHVCRALFSESAWYFVSSYGREGQLFLIKDDGSFRNAEGIGSSCQDLAISAEATAVGLIENGFFMPTGNETTIDLTMDGKVRPMPTPLYDSWKASYSSGWLEGKGHGLVRQPEWSTSANEKSGCARRLGDDWLLLNWHHWTNEPRREAKLLDAQGNELASRVIALARSNDNDTLSSGVPIRRKEGGFWLVDPQGCYASFGSDLRRLDPLPFFKHLNTRGSWDLDLNERIHFFELLWALVALPICLLIGLALARILRKETYQGLCWGGTVYLLPACWVLWRILPILK